MTTTDTMDTKATVNQAIRMVNAGCEYVRITAPSLKEANNLVNIKDSLIRKGYKIPLIADIHFTPNAAEIAARIVEKVRINPGNYSDKKKFKNIDYDDSSYARELERIREKFTPLVKICSEYGTAMRIGTNHGSLSDRIMSRYGDTPIGMVESALEYLEICEDYNFYNVVLSMKASNPLVMVHAYRLLVSILDKRNFKKYPLHLGVTEAGEGEDGRIKSSLGIGTLLEDGLGDTIRVSLTEEPEFEPPIAKIIVDRYSNRNNHKPIDGIKKINYNPFEYNQRQSFELKNIGDENLPCVILDLSNLKKISKEDLLYVGYNFYNNSWTNSDIATDFIYVGKHIIDFSLPNDLKIIIDYDKWISLDKRDKCYPIINEQKEIEKIFNDKINSNAKIHPELNFLRINVSNVNSLLLKKISNKKIVLVIESSNKHALVDFRQFFMLLIENEINNPIVITREYDLDNFSKLRLYSSIDVGGLLIDGFGNGIMVSKLKNHNLKSIEKLNSLSFKILQASRTRITSTDFISCPSCGRTLFDLGETTAKIREKTSHLKGLKIGIMGCIVNGPGEMADADYGYVGSGKEKITLYRKKEIVKKGIHYKEGVNELVNLIKLDGNWIEP